MALFGSDWLDDYDSMKEYEFSTIHNEEDESISYDKPIFAPIHDDEEYDSLKEYEKKITLNIMYNIDLKTNDVIYLPLELSEVTQTIGNFDNEEKLVNSKYYVTTLNFAYNTFLVTT